MQRVDIHQLVRPNIRRLKPYASARHEFSGTADIYLDANENPFPSGYNRYPDPHAMAVLEQLRSTKGVPPAMTVLGNGSDELIDLIYRIFCEPGKDQVIILPPTYGMYRVAADIANVAVREIPLTENFQPRVQEILQAYERSVKVLWLCTPNNPSGNDFSRSAAREILDQFPGIVVIDEAYIDFAGRASYTEWLRQYPNLIVLQTFSKAYGLAGIRLGMAFANPPVIDLFRKVKPPYNINQLTQDMAVRALADPTVVTQQVATILSERDRLARLLLTLRFVETIYPSDANFLLVKVTEPRALYEYLRDRGIVVRDRSQQPGCAGCLRLTVGLPKENEELMTALEEWQA